MMQENMLVTAQRKIADNIFEIKLHGEMTAAVSQPGQFVHIRVNGSDSINPLLRRPISICSVDKKEKEMTLIYRRSGLGTDLLSHGGKGGRIDVLGPLGHGFPLQQAEAAAKVLIVGGGVGIPPLYGLSRELAGKGVRITHVLGFRSAKDVFYEDRFSGLGRTVLLTEDGTGGRKGRVTDVLDGIDFTAAFACGPLPMLKAIKSLIPDKPLYLSLEQRMACGIGACLACAVRVSDKNDAKGYRRVCCDGPVFRAGEVELC